jgi:hypothetical protein
MIKKIILRVVPALLVLFAATVVCAEDVASGLFDRHQQLVYQIRMIDKRSGDKSSIGSGFQVSADGHIATNFHVVSSYIHKPKEFRLEYVAHDGSVGPLTLAGFDVIHDLAIVKSAEAPRKHFKLRSAELHKGDRIYSMGNPRDLGMTIIEGNYNGLIKTSRYRKILFSGSLNPGMSGGPALDSNGRIIGMNVSKGGEQLSFLVPATYLKKLLDDVRSGRQGDDYKLIIQEALLADQDDFYGSLLQQEWKQEPLAEVKLPSQLDSSLKCWGHTLDDEDILYESVRQHCRSQDVIYLDEGFLAGSFHYDYEWMEAGSLNRFQFYNLMESRFTHKRMDNSYSKEHSTNFGCHTDFVEIDERRWRVSACTRGYRDYAGLYDVVLLLAAVQENDRGVVVRIGAAGISQSNALGLLKKFTESISWTN